jgi:hypothetical protein
VPQRAQRFAHRDEATPSSPESSVSLGSRSPSVKAPTEIACTMRETTCSVRPSSPIGAKAAVRRRLGGDCVSELFTDNLRSACGSVKSFPRRE